jgi:hypothetical protein
MKPCMVSLAVVVLCGTLLTPVASAGPVAGNLSLANPTQADAAGAQIEIVCPAGPEKGDRAGGSATAEKPTKPEQVEKPASVYKASVRLPGPYLLNVKEEGDCTLTVSYQGKTASMAIVSKSGVARYDLVLTLAGGKLNLRRQ